VRSRNLLPLLLAGCAAGPDYRPPEVAAPEVWSAAESARVSQGAADLARWWRVLDDPTLDSLMERAAAANLDLAIATARVRQARAEAGFARGELLPEVDARASAGRQRVSENGVLGALPDPESDLYSAGFDARWELDLFGRLRRRVEAADAEVEASVEDRRDVLVSLLAEVARAYVELRANQRLAAVVRENAASARTTVELTRTRLASGLASELDVARAEALLATTEARLPEVEGAARVAMHRLAVLLGLEPGALVAELEPVRPIPAAPERVLVGLPSELLARRPDVRAAERRLAAATARLGSAEAERYPSLSLSAAFGLESLSSGTLADAASRAWSIGPALRWPIFAGGRIEADVEGADARLEEARHRYDQAMLVALEDVENALVGYLRTWDQRRSLASAAEAGRRSVRLADDLYRNGLSDFLDVLDAERALYDAELELARSEAAATLRVVTLYKVLGGGWEAEG